MKIENLIQATIEFEKIEKLCRSKKTVSFEDRQKINAIEEKFGVKYEQSEVMSDVLDFPNIEQKLRDAMIEVYKDVLLSLATEYEGNFEKEKSLIASCLIDDIE